MFSKLRRIWRKTPLNVERTAEGLIRQRIEATNLTRGREEDFDFYIRAYRQGLLNYRDLRKIGRELTKDEKKTLGVSLRIKIADGYVSTLNERGLINPLRSCELLSGPISSACQNLEHLRSIAKQDGLFAKFEPSNMLAGPCAAAKAYDGEVLDPATAIPPPLPNCTHPDQCACFYRAHFDLDTIVDGLYDGGKRKD